MTETMAKTEWVALFVLDVQDTKDVRALARQAVQVFDDFAPVADVLPGRIELELETVGSDVEAASEHVTRFWKSVASAKLDLAPELGSIESLQLKERAESTAPNLLGVAELALVLGVGKTRARQLATGSDFPHPVTTLAATPVWNALQIRRWGAEHGRRVKS